MVGGSAPDQIDQLFVSIQSFNSRSLADTITPDYYDMIIVDEFHHAAAPSYQRLLTTFTPHILLGLTATPERMDDLDILAYFNGRISAEIRLPEAINRKLLSPFHYFGITDVVNLDAVPWKRGTYDSVAISKLYTGNKERVQQIILGLQKYTSDVSEIIGLGFCVSIEHAEFMADSFTQAGIPSACLHSGSAREERNSIQQRLKRRDIHFIFVVDLYNEGIDIPEINTVLFLRPTESLTVFLQQLGRGLRLSEGKECLTVLDFVGRQHVNYQFGARMSAMLSVSQNPLVQQVEEDAYYLPRGCYLHLEKVAQERILENIKANIATKKSLIQKIRNFSQDTGKELRLKNFLAYHSLTPALIYQKNTFCELAREAGVLPDSDRIRRGFPKKAALRMMDVDAPLLLLFYQSVIQHPDTISSENSLNSEKNMLAMLWYTFHDKPYVGSAQNIREIFSDTFENSHIRDNY